MEASKDLFIVNIFGDMMIDRVYNVRSWVRFPIVGGSEPVKAFLLRTLELVRIIGIDIKPFTNNSWSLVKDPMAAGISPVSLFENSCLSKVKE